MTIHLLVEMEGGAFHNAYAFTSSDKLRVHLETRCGVVGIAYATAFFFGEDNEEYERLWDEYDNLAEGAEIFYEYRIITVE